MSNMRTVTIGFVIGLIVVGIGGYYVGRTLTWSDAYQKGYDIGYEEGVGAAPAPMFPKGTVKIGCELPLTGSFSRGGHEGLQGAQLAVEEVNEAGGVAGYKVEIVTADVEELEAGTVTRALENLILKENVAAILTNWPTSSQFELDLVAKYDQIYMYCGESQMTEQIVSPNPENYPTVFNINPSYKPGQTAIREILGILVEEGELILPNKKVFIITSDCSYSRYFSEANREDFIEHGYEVVGYEMVPFGSVTEWGPILEKIRANDPGLIVNHDWIPTNNILFIEQFLERPTKSWIALNYAPSTREFIDALGEKGNGVLSIDNIMLTTHVTDWYRAQELSEKFYDKWGYYPGPEGARLQCMVHIWADGVNKHGDPFDQLGVAKAMMEITHYDCEGGTVEFDPTTHTSKPMQSCSAQLWDGVVRHFRCYDAGPDYNTRLTEYEDWELREPPWFEEA